MAGRRVSVRGGMRAGELRERRVLPVRDVGHHRGDLRPIYE